jgi:hypothetical protein
MLVFYHLAKDDKDISKYLRNKYLRKNEMISYFDNRLWKANTIIDNTKPTFLRFVYRFVWLG